MISRAQSPLDVYLYCSHNLLTAGRHYQSELRKWERQYPANVYTRNGTEEETMLDISMTYRMAPNVQEDEVESQIAEKGTWGTFLPSMSVKWNDLLPCQSMLSEQAFLDRNKRREYSSSPLIKREYSSSLRETFLQTKRVASPWNLFDPFPDYRCFQKFLGLVTDSPLSWFTQLHFLHVKNKDHVSCLPLLKSYI